MAIYFIHFKFIILDFFFKKKKNLKWIIFISKIKMKFFEKQIERIKNIKTKNLGLFGNIVLLTLFVFFENTRG